jgi:hypothetical protein
MTKLTDKVRKIYEVPVGQTVDVVEVPRGVNGNFSTVRFFCDSMGHGYDINSQGSRGYGAVQLGTNFNGSALHKLRDSQYKNHSIRFLSADLKLLRFAYEGRVCGNKRKDGEQD